MKKDIIYPHRVSMFSKGPLHKSFNGPSEILRFTQDDIHGRRVQNDKLKPTCHSEESWRRSHCGPPCGEISGCAKLSFSKGLILSGLLILGLVFGSATVFAHSADAPGDSENGEMPHDPGAMPGMDRLKLGETVYKHMCTFCHGADGNGGGKAMAYLYPWPRDFRKGVFKHHSTPSGSLPLDADIYRTIVRGVPGTAMPAWKNALTEEEIWSVIQYIKGFSQRFQTEMPKPAIQPGPVPPVTAESIAAGEKLYQEMRCARCHGTDLKGEGALADQLYDIWDHRVFVYDLTDPNAYKFGYEMEDIYMALTTGIDGTPMKTYSHLTDEERWDIAVWVRSKIDLDRFQGADYETDLYSTKIDEEIGLDPDHELWKKIPEQVVHLIPLNARKNPVNNIGSSR